MNANELADYFRSQVRDDVAPYLWSDEEVLTYMNEAQKMFVRLTNGIYDVSSQACLVDVAAGEKFSTLHPAVLEVRKAYYVDPNNGYKRELPIISLADIDSLSTSDYGVYHNPSIQDLPGRVDYMLTGEERGKVRWISVPTENATVELAIARMPLTTLTTTQLVLEVPAEHHVYLIEWMKHLAYNKQDGDAFNPKTSTESEMRFRAYCDFVWKEWERYRHTHRSIAYGGI
jgi:hypothetical protein